MTAREAADITAGVQQTDHSDVVLKDIRDAARRGERSLTLTHDLTGGTVAALKRLGYSVYPCNRSIWEVGRPGWRSDGRWVVSW